jgi:hypothetical protein
MDLKLYEIINLEQAIDELIKYDLSFTFKVSLDIMQNKEACKNITDLFFNRMSKIFDSYEKLYDASLRTEEESIIFNEALNTTVDVHIKQLSVNDIVIEDNVKVKLVLFNNLKPMLIDY